MTHTFLIEPDTYHAFENEAEQLDKCKEWGLLSEKASKTKTFFYKGNGRHLVCSIVGYVDKITAVIEFDDKGRHCIHPSFLKEMQASTYGQKPAASDDEAAQPAAAAPESQPLEAATETQQEQAEAPSKPAATGAVAPQAEQSGTATAKDEPPAKETGKKGKAQKLQLPEEKVKMTATVQAFTTVPNNFTEGEDEVIIYEAVSIAEPAIDVGAAWSSHSATLKKLELAIGDTIAFEGKIIAKKLTKHPVPYKINNPAKIQKQ